MFEKLYKYIGKDIKTLIDRTDASYVIRLQKNRVFYVREDMMRRATNVRQLCLSPPCADIFWCTKPLKAKHERWERYWPLRMRARRSRGRSSYRWAPASGSSHTPASSGWASARWTSSQNTQNTRCGIPKTYRDCKHSKTQQNKQLHPSSAAWNTMPVLRHLQAWMTRGSLGNWCAAR